MRKIVIALSLLYIVSYVVFRSMHVEVWDQDGDAYVMFPENPKAIYYAFRPLTYLDGALTGMRFRIGPHQ